MFICFILKYTNDLTYYSTYGFIEIHPNTLPPPLSLILQKSFVRLVVRFNKFFTVGSSRRIVFGKSSTKIFFVTLYCANDKYC